MMIQEKNDLRIVRTNKMLRDAFTRLLEVKSFEDITVNQLCEEAMIRRATFYKHFADKYEYLNFYLQGFKEEFNRQTKDSTVHESTQEFYLRMSDYLFEFLESHQKMVSHIVSSNALPLFFDILCEQISNNLIEIMTANEDIKDMKNVSIELVSKHCAGGLLQLAKYWYMQRHTISREELHTSIAFLINQIIPAK